MMPLEAPPSLPNIGMNGSQEDPASLLFKPSANKRGPGGMMVVPVASPNPNSLLMYGQGVSNVSAINFI